MKLSVCTWKWNDPSWKFHGRKGYTARHVNTLQKMVTRHLHMPHDFCCITDDPEGLDPSIRVIPLWEDCQELGACWRRLRAFSKDMLHVIGPRFCSIDLDVLIVRDITPILGPLVPFKIWEDGRPDVNYNGGFWSMISGARSHIWDNFKPEFHPRWLHGILGSDQAYLNQTLHYEETWGTTDGVYSYRWHIKGKKNGLPRDARMVFFHGPWDPAHPLMQARHPWIKEHYR